MTENKKLAEALHRAEEGFYVFPLKKNGKKPAHVGWQDEATRDQAAIREYFDNGKDFNIGVYTEKFDVIDTLGNYKETVALAVVDVDTKEGKAGKETMRELDILGYDFPPTYTVKTASGGLHHVYTHPYPLSGGANKIGQHVDLKSHGHYIVGAGSTIDGTPYERIFSAQENPIAHNDIYFIAEAPAWLEEKAGRPMERTNTGNQVIEHLDTDQALTRARDFIKNAPTAAPGMRNDTAYKVAARLHDLGISEPQAQALMFDWNQNHCHPHLDQEEVEATTASAYKGAKKPAGNDSPHAVFEAVPTDPKDEAQRQQGKPPLYRINWNDIAPNNDAKPLIRNYLDQDSVSILYGDSNTGKTFIALDLAFHVATGKPWNGNDTAQGGAIYLAAEGGRSIINRVLALKQHHGEPQHVPFTLIPCQVNLFDSIPDFKAFVSLIHQAEADQNIGPARLIVIDTLSRVLAGGNENDSQDMGEFVKNVTFIKERFKSHVLIVHHSGKDAAKGARGHSLLRAAVDTELEIADGLITTRKQRDMEFGKPLGFELRKTEVGTDYQGKPLTSCIVSYVDPEARNAFNQENRLSHRDLIALLALERAEGGKQLRNFSNVVEQKTWAQCCKDFDLTQIPGATPWPKSDDSFREVFKRCRNRLVAFNRVIEVEEKQWAILKTQHPATPATNGGVA